MRNKKSKESERKVAESDRNAIAVAEECLSDERVATAISILTPRQRKLLVSGIVKSILKQNKTLRAGIATAIKQKCHVRVEQLEYDDIPYVRQDQVLKVIEES